MSNEKREAYLNIERQKLTIGKKRKKMIPGIFLIEGLIFIFRPHKMTGIIKILYKHFYFSCNRRAKRNRRQVSMPRLWQTIYVRRTIVHPCGNHSLQWTVEGQIFTDLSRTWKVPFMWLSCNPNFTCFTFWWQAPSNFNLHGRGQTPVVYVDEKTELDKLSWYRRFVV